jgi:hypothetical protein
MLSRADLDTPSPFNTYVVDGLPPSPIGNPGRASLEAVANPSRTHDLFFVADGTGRKAFAETYEEHLRNVARWRDLNSASIPPPSSSGILTGAGAGGDALATQRAVLYEEPLETETAVAGVTAINAVVTWRFAENGPSGPEIEANLEVPDRSMKIRLSIRRNTDPTLPASHLVEAVVDTPADFPGKGIRSIPRLVFKLSEGDRGLPLIGAAAKVADGFFWIALSSAESDLNQNLQLMRERQWIDLPIVYHTNQRAILTFKKGTPGDRVFQRAFAAWSTGSDGETVSAPLPAKDQDRLPTSDTQTKIASDNVPAAEVPDRYLDVAESLVVFDGRDPTVFEGASDNPIQFDSDAEGGFARISSATSAAGARAVIGPGLAERLAGKTVRITLLARSSNENGAATMRFAYQSGLAISHWQSADLSASYGTFGMIWRVPAVRTVGAGDYLLIEPGIPGDGTSTDIRSIKIDILAG